MSIRFWLECRWWDLIQCRYPGEICESDFGPIQTMCSRVRFHRGEHWYDRHVFVNGWPR